MKRRQEWISYNLFHAQLELNMLFIMLIILECSPGFFKLKSMINIISESLKAGKVFTFTVFLV